MKAIVQEEIHQPLVFKEVPTPTLQANEALIRVKAAALNHRDVWINKGMYPGIKPNIILGSDGAGIVEAVGEKSAQDWVGKEVIICPSHNWGDNSAFQAPNYKILGLPENGSFAEYVKVDSKYLVEKPVHLSFEEAAALPLAGLTAYRALFTRAQFKEGDRVLISGVGGGVALFAFQFAVAGGGKVYVTSGSEEKIAKAKAMGALGGANYKEDNWAKRFAKEVGTFDVIIDSAMGKGFNDLVKLADFGGRIAFYGGTRGKVDGLNPQIIFWKQLSILGSTMGSDLEFQKMVDFVKKTKLKPVVDSVFPLKDANSAFERMEKGKQFGKIVLTIE